MVMEKQKAYAFTTPNLEYCSPSSKRRRIEEEEEEMEERERVMWFGQEGYRGVVLCEFGEEWRSLYREGRGVKVRPYGWVWVGNWF